MSSTKMLLAEIAKTPWAANFSSLAEFDALTLGVSNNFGKSLSDHLEGRFWGEGHGDFRGKQ